MDINFTDHTELAQAVNAAGHEVAYVVTTNEHGVVKLFDAGGGELVSLHTQDRMQLGEAFSQVGQHMNAYTPSEACKLHGGCDMHMIAALRKYES